MEIMNQYQHVRLRSGMYGLHGNHFCMIFKETILHLLHDYSFTVLKITTVSEQNQVIFEASERCEFSPVDNTFPFTIIGGVCSSAKFSAEYKNGSFCRTILKNTEIFEESFKFVGNSNLKQLECNCVLPEKFPVDDNFARGTIHQISKIFPHCRIIYNDHEYSDGVSKNKVKWFLHLKHKYEPYKTVPVYEFNGRSGSFIWEVAFCFALPDQKLYSFINGFRTEQGGTYVDCVTKTIEQAFQKVGKIKDFPLNKMSLAVSIHLPPNAEIAFDGCRLCGTNYHLASEHQEFQLLAKELKSQIIKYFSDHNK